MKLTIFLKLFLAIFLSMLLTLAAMTASVQWQFRQGFDEYLRKVEEQRLEPLLLLLEQDYGRNGSWDFLRDNFPYWLGLLRSVRGEEPEPEIPGPPPPPPFADEFRLFPPPHVHPHGPPEGPFRHGHLRVLDAERMQLIGPPFPIEPGPNAILRPIAHKGKTVGWLEFSPRRIVTDRLQAAFIEQHSRAVYVFLALVIGVALVVSLLLARQFRAPIGRLATAVQSLAAGHYDQRIPVSGRDELARLARDFNVLADVLERNEAARRQWVADTSHELRTPLAILRSEVEALLDGVREPTPDKLRSLHSEILMLNQLVDDLFLLSVHDSGALGYRMESLDLGRLLQEAVETCTNRFEAKKIRLVPHLNESQNIRGDAARLRQVFLNLLENSLRYTASGGHCELSLQESGDRAIVDIRDSAPGVPETALAHLFERFYRVDKSRSRELGGVRAGSRHLQNHRRGPRRYDQRIPFTPGRIMDSGRFADNMSLSAMNMAMKRILVVEDERKLAEVLREYLAQAGYETEWLSEGGTVAAWVLEQRPDLVLLDLMLPGRDGLDICRDIRKFSNVPIIMITARVEEIDRLLGLELGADDYICKPYSPREVVARVRALFRRMEAFAAGRTSAAEFMVDQERMSISVRGRPLDLTPVEFRLLAALLEHPGRVYTREQLLARLYLDHRIVTDRTVDSHIKNIRKKIAPFLPDSERLVSVYGVGYKFEDWGLQP